MCRDMGMWGQLGAALRTCFGILIMPAFGAMLSRRTRGVNVEHKRPHAHFAKSLLTLPNMMNKFGTTIPSSDSISASWRHHQCVDHIPLYNFVFFHLICDLYVKFFHHYIDVFFRITFVDWIDCKWLHSTSE